MTVIAKPSKVIELAQRRLDESPLGRLTELHLKRLVFLINDYLKLEHFRIDIDTDIRPRTITIVPLDADKKPLRMRFKNEAEMLERITGFVQAPDFMVKFHNEH